MRCWCLLCGEPRATYTYIVEAYDVAGNVSPASPARSIRTYRAPARLAVSLVSGRPQLAWTASTDITGVVGYAIYRSTSGVLGPKVASTTATTWLDTNVQAGVTYAYGIRAYDAAGNMSASSTLVQATAQ